MKRSLTCAMLLLAGCQSLGIGTPAQTAAVEYGATSHDPFWMVSVGKEAILLTSTPPGGRADGEIYDRLYPRRVYEEANGVRRWSGGQGVAVIAVEARPGPCTTGGRVYADRANIYLSGRMMTGCGGRELTDGKPG